MQRLREQKRDVGYAIMPSSVHEDQVALNDSDFEKYYNEHQESYRKPETASFEYLELSSASLAAEVKVTDDALRAYYDANHATYTTTEERTLITYSSRYRRALRRPTSRQREPRPTICSSEPGPVRTLRSWRENSPTTPAARRRWRNRIVPARCDGSSVRGSCVQTARRRNQFTGAHEFRLSPDQGQGNQRRRIAPVRRGQSRCRSCLSQCRGAESFIDQAEQFSNLVYEHPDSLTVAADALNLKSQTTASMTKAEIAAQYSDKLAAAVFEADVLVDGLNSEPVEMPDGRVMRCA